MDDSDDVTLRGRGYSISCITTMASVNAARVPPSVCQSVKTDGRKCFIQSIDTSLGYNQYFLIDMDSGAHLKRSRYELEPLPVELVPPADDNAFEDSMDEPTLQESEEKNGEPAKKRFAAVSNEELDQIELNRTSIRTKRQTAWAVGIFKGKHSSYE